MDFNSKKKTLIYNQEKNFEHTTVNHNIIFRKKKQYFEHEILQLSY